MYVTPKQRQRYIRNIIIIAVAIPLTIIAGYSAVQWFSQAGTNDPDDIVVSNVTPVSATITWVTADKTSSQVVVIDSDGNESQPYLDARSSSSRQTHYVEIPDLEPSTEYNFVISSSGEEYTDEGGNSFKFTTAGLSEDTPVPNPAYGSLLEESDDALVYILLSDKSSTVVSATPSSTGNWIMDLSTLRLTADSSLVSVTDSTELTIVAQAGDRQGATYTGTYSQIFDEDGRLLDSVNLSFSEMATVATHLPTESIIGEGYVATEPDPDPVPVETEEPDTTYTPPSTYTPTTPLPTGKDDSDLEEEPDVSFDPSTREFRMVQDVPWTNLIATSSGTTTSYTFPVGQESIQVTNVSDTGVTVVWLSEEEEEGSVMYGTSLASVSEDGLDVRDSLSTKGSYYSHAVDLTDLTPDTTYYYEISSGSDTYDQNGSPFTITTYETLAAAPPFKTVSGTITGLDDSKDSVVLLELSDEDATGTSGTSGIVSVTPDTNGSWIADIGSVRNSDGSDYFTSTDGDELTVSAIAMGESDTLTESTTDLDNKTVALTVTPAVLSGATYTSVDQLTDYGVSAVSVPYSGTDINAGIGGPSGGGSYTTPKTAISTPLVVALAGGISMVGVGLIYVAFGGRKKSNKTKGQMRSSL